ncbi:unnamed protein product [Adineta steineri]|uniref:RanBD1 domain-containing protein n=1 Tax=Adineta steineri TaxID=433720 RepID=A0A814IV81_9BILA|nr:unnamed protein product [Adineta steineri]
MSKRKKNDPTPDEAEEEDNDNNLRDKHHKQAPPQKVYDFHKKTIEVYPERLRELNRQFVASVSSQISDEPYSVLVGNCLDYVRQYFNYEDDLLQYSPWLATRLKQSRSDIVKCLQETIDVYEALARHDFDHLIDKNASDVSSDEPIRNRNDISEQLTIPSYQFRPSSTTSTASVSNFMKPLTTTATSDSTGFNSTKSTTTTAASDSTPTTGFSLGKSTAASDTTPSSSFSFGKSTATNDSKPSTGFSLGKSTSNNDSTPSAGFSLAKSTSNNDTTPVTGFSFGKSTSNNDSTSSTGFSLGKSSANNDSTPSTGFNLAKSTSNNDSTPTPSFSFGKSTSNNDATPSSSFSFGKSTAASDTTPSASFSFGKSAAANDTTPLTGFSFGKSTATSDSTPSAGFTFKMPTTSASPDKSGNTSPFAFSIPNTGFGTSTFSSPTSINPTNTDKSSTGLGSSISFTPPPKFSFTPTPSATTEQQGTTEDNEDESAEPPEPEKVEHEAGAKLTYRCRMAVTAKDVKLIKRGPVQVVLKESNDKNQLIVRSDDSLGRLFLNIIWSKIIEIKKNSTKDITFGCKLNPGMPEIKEGDVAVILFRFDNETDRNDAYEKLNKERT